MEGPLLEQYDDLSELDVPVRHRDRLAALREAVRLQIMVCRRLPAPFLLGRDRQIGLWTSVGNEWFNTLARMVGVDPFDELRRKSK